MPTVNFHDIYKNTDTGQIGPIVKMYSSEPSQTNPLLESIAAVIIAGQIVELENGLIPSPWVIVGETALTSFKAEVIE